MYPGLPFFDVPLYSFVIKGYRPCVFLLFEAYVFSEIGKRVIHRSSFCIGLGLKAFG